MVFASHPASIRGLCIVRSEYLRAHHFSGQKLHGLADYGAGGGYERALWLAHIPDICPRIPCNSMVKFDLTMDTKL